MKKGVAVSPCARASAICYCYVVKIGLDWQKKAIVIFIATISLLSILLTIFAIRAAEMERLTMEREIEREQRRLADLIISQVGGIISELEGRMDRLLRSYQVQSHEELAEACKRIMEGEEIVIEIFLVDEKGSEEFPHVEPLFLSSEAGGNTELGHVPQSRYLLASHDLDKDGVVSRAEVQQVSLPPHEWRPIRAIHRIRGKFSQIDIDGNSELGRSRYLINKLDRDLDGHLDMTELKAAAEASKQGPIGLRKYTLDLLFERLDTNQDKLLTAKELREYERLAHWLDSDGNRMVNRQEFSEFYTVSMKLLRPVRRPDPVSPEAAKEARPSKNIENDVLERERK